MCFKYYWALDKQFQHRTVWKRETKLQWNALRAPLTVSSGHTPAGLEEVRPSSEGHCPHRPLPSRRSLSQVGLTVLKPHPSFISKALTSHCGPVCLTLLSAKAVLKGPLISPGQHLGIKFKASCSHVKHRGGKGAGSDSLPHSPREMVGEIQQ